MGNWLSVFSISVAEHKDKNTHFFQGISGLTSSNVRVCWHASCHIPNSASGGSECPAQRNSTACSGNYLKQTFSPQLLSSSSSFSLLDVLAREYPLKEKGWGVGRDVPCLDSSVWLQLWIALPNSPPYKLWCQVTLWIKWVVKQLKKGRTLSFLSNFSFSHSILWFPRGGLKSAYICFCHDLQNLPKSSLKELDLL